MGHKVRLSRCRAMMPKEAFHRELRACLSREMRVVFFLNAASRTRSQIASEANSVNVRPRALVQIISVGQWGRMRSWRRIDLRSEDSVPDSGRSLVFEA